MTCKKVWLKIHASKKRATQHMGVWVPKKNPKSKESKGKGQGPGPGEGEEGQESHCGPGTLSR